MKRKSTVSHRWPRLFLTRTADLLIRMSTGVLSKRSSETVRNHRNAVRHASEWLSAMGRNLQTMDANHGRSASSGAFCASTTASAVTADKPRYPHGHAAGPARLHLDLWPPHDVQVGRAGSRPHNIRPRVAV